MNETQIHLQRLGDITGETDVELLLPVDHYECAVCGKVAHVDTMLQPTGLDNGELCCSESCCWDYNQLASEICHGE
jgi:hypothetical protein